MALVDFLRHSRKERVTFHHQKATAAAEMDGGIHQAKYLYIREGRVWIWPQPSKMM